MTNASFQLRSGFVIPVAGGVAASDNRALAGPLSDVEKGRLGFATRASHVKKDRSGQS